VCAHGRSATARLIATGWLAGLLAATGIASAQGPERAAGAAAPAADAACVTRAVEKIQRRYEAVRDLSADFVQTSRSVALGGPGSAATSHGTVVFAKPGKMRWAYDDPEPSVVVSDGHWLWIYDPAHQEVQKLLVGDGFLSGAAIQFLLGEGKIERDFAVSAEACSDAKVELVLVPRREASYEKLRVRSDPASGELLETTVVDLLGNVTQVAFSHTRTNLHPADALFSFPATPGVKVIELENPTRKAP
jgi:outer membrane lipoprotein carrier protein